MALQTRNEQSVSVINVQANDVGAVGTNAQEDTNKKEIERLEKPNKTYEQFAPLWQFYLNAYEGGEAFANEFNLFRHPREHPDDFQERTKRVYYHNYCEPLVDFFTGFIYAETIQRDFGELKDFFTGFINNVNRKGDDLTTFMRQLSDDMQIFGLVYVLVDTPPKDASIVTVAQEKEAGIQPYWVSVRPSEILDWVADENDQFIYVKRKQCITTMDGFKPVKIDRYTEWTLEQIQVSEVDVTEPTKPVYRGKKNFTNELKKIGLVPIRYKRSKMDSFMGHSFLSDIAYLAREVMNLTSLLQEFLYRQCFNILAMEEDPNVPEIEQMQGEISTANMLKYPKDTKPPQYITPPVQPAEFLQSERSANVQAMYRMAAQDTVNELFNGQKSSGYSKSQSFRTTVPKIASRADALERAEHALFSLTCEYLGKKWAGTIKYKDHYEITNLTDALSQMTTLFKDLQLNSKTFASAQLKRMVHEFDGKLTPEQIKSVESEIDGINWDEWFDTMKLAFIGRAAASPEAGMIMDSTGKSATPVKGKDTATAASTPQRAQGTSAEIQKEASKS